MTYITEENKIKLIKRTKSFLWRLADIVLIAVLNYIAASLKLFDLPAEVVGILGLVLGEITKALNTKVVKN